mmetsp:Transcript_8560/g.10086  ORF Transcript_8560/g.10086 Transcript_8560/m.10086 type:complete len:121 (-) Transcript_8560:387-749(-)|eukprot:CAMPEP_0204830692 /NCGR_PEP_ID=MMETSP1346-20131115/9107_1 /ASSEMBLY_ACC=CAM_ASM_000771 /TAXON_ID=215587 /ORGANISM="Aplanochytrium stocchinoi, Strain GSBS06" /LENGTH=120 /DNA_ID=CAMNT_0051961169 /DNA_START=198 /DNA_END=560 /DNA_ORIENTATION=+
MSEFWSKAKAKAEEMAESAKNNSIQTKLHAEKLVLQRKVRIQKEEFGKEVYDAMDLQNQELTKQVFLKYKENIEALNSKIAGKDSEIAALKTKDPNSATVSSNDTQTQPSTSTSESGMAL